MEIKREFNTKLKEPPRDPNASIKKFRSWKKMNKIIAKGQTIPVKSN